MRRRIRFRGDDAFYCVYEVKRTGWFRRKVTPVGRCLTAADPENATKALARARDYPEAVVMFVPPTGRAKESAHCKRGKCTFT